MGTLVGRIQDLIKRNRMEQALQELDTWAAKNDEDLHNSIILQTARFNQLRRNERLGVISREEAGRTRNQILYSLLSLLEDIPGDAMASAEAGREFEPAPAYEQPYAEKEKPNKAKAAPKKLKLFISYARKDRSHVDRLVVHLSALKRSGHLESWSDSELFVGGKWNDEIKAKLQTANIILYLVSPDFIFSPFITENERVWAEEARINNGAQIVPVLVDFCDWEEEDFAQYNGVPIHPDSRQLEPISSPAWVNKELAYHTVVKELKRLIKRGN